MAGNWQYRATAKGMPSALMLELQSEASGHIQRLFQLSEVSEWKHSGFNPATATPEEDEPDDEDDSLDEPYSGRDENDYDPSEFYDLEPRR